MFHLKADLKYPHHYIIGVSNDEKHPETIFLKYGPIYFSNDDVEKLNDSLMLLDDKIYTDIYKMSPSDIYDMLGCSSLMMSFISFKLILQSKLAAVYYFPYAFEVSDPYEFFRSYVERANENKLEKEGLKNARIRYTEEDN